MTQINNWAHEFRVLCADDLMANDGGLADFDKNINIIVERAITLAKEEERKRIVEIIRQIPMNRKTDIIIDELINKICEK